MAADADSFRLLPEPHCSPRVHSVGRSSSRRSRHCASYVLAAQDKRRACRDLPNGSAAVAPACWLGCALASPVRWYLPAPRCLSDHHRPVLPRAAPALANALALLGTATLGVHHRLADAQREWHTTFRHRSRVRCQYSAAVGAWGALLRASNACGMAGIRWLSPPLQQALQPFPRAPRGRPDMTASMLTCVVRTAERVLELPRQHALHMEDVTTECTAALLPFLRRQYLDETGSRRARSRYVTSPCAACTLPAASHFSAASASQPCGHCPSDTCCIYGIIYLRLRRRPSLSLSPRVAHGLSVHQLALLISTVGARDIRLSSHSEHVSNYSMGILLFFIHSWPCLLAFTTKSHLLPP